jgi:hypothetical protein
MSFFEDASLVYIPAAIKNGKTYSIKPTDGTGDLTFTRASSATRVGPNGYIEKVRTNLALYSEQLQFFLSYAGDASVTADTTISPNGTQNADTISATGSLDHVFYNLGAGASGKTYTFSAYYKGTAGQTIRMRFLQGGGGTDATKYITLTGEWQRESITFTGGSSYNIYYLIDRRTDEGTATSFAAWGCQLEESDVMTDYIATTTAAVSVGPVSGTPRLDYLGSDCGRLLLEPQRTNLITNSEASASWIKVNVTNTSNSVISPDGYQNADTITSDGTSGSHYFGFNAPSVTGGTSYTASLFVKNGTGQYFQLLFGSGGFSTTKYINYDLNAGTITYTGTGTSGTITNYGNGWYRLTMTATCDTSTTETFYAAIITTATAARVQSNTSTAYYYAWGAQLEASAGYSSSYVPTLGTAVTRVADLAQKTSVSALIGQTEGTIYWEVEIFTAQNVGAEDILVIDNGVATNLLYISKSFVNNSLIADMYVSSVRQAFFQTSALSLGIHKAAIAYANNNTAFFVDGVQVGTTDTSCSVPAMNRIQLGNGVLGPSINKTAQLLVFPTRLSDSQLAELTSL